MLAVEETSEGPGEGEGKRFACGQAAASPGLNPVRPRCRFLAWPERSVRSRRGPRARVGRLSPTPSLGIPGPRGPRHRPQDAAPRFARY